MPDQESPQPFKIMKPRNSGRVQSCFAENDALRAERQILFSTIDQLKEENAKLKEGEETASIIFNDRTILIEHVERERDELKQELTNLTAYGLDAEERTEKKIARYQQALERITRECDGIAFKVAHDALHPVPPSTDA